MNAWGAEKKREVRGQPRRMPYFFSFLSFTVTTFTLYLGSYEWVTVICLDQKHIGRKLKDGPLRMIHAFLAPLSEGSYFANSQLPIAVKISKNIKSGENASH